MISFRKIIVKINWTSSILDLGDGSCERKNPDPELRSAKRWPIRCAAWPAQLSMARPEAQRALAWCARLRWTRARCQRAQRHAGHQLLRPCPRALVSASALRPLLTRAARRAHRQLTLLTWLALVLPSLVYAWHDVFRPRKIPYTKYGLFTFLLTSADFTLWNG